ncbi:hypothetical protein ACFIQG_07105 [Comamonas odontotermitis]
MTTSSRSTCPSACPLKGSGCYAESGPISWHWNKVSNDRGYDLDQLCAEIAALPKHQMWRWAQAGDLPGDGVLIDDVALAKIAKANTGRKGFGYTHYDPTIPHNAQAIAAANAAGFALSVSANGLEHADQLAALKVAPVVTIMPEVTTEKISSTPGGEPIVICPASIRDQAEKPAARNITCATCGLCQVGSRKSIVGFPAHGVTKKRAEKVFWINTVTG